MTTFKILPFYLREVFHLQIPANYCSGGNILWGPGCPPLLQTVSADPLCRMSPALDKYMFTVNKNLRPLTGRPLLFFQSTAELPVLLCHGFSIWHFLQCLPALCFPHVAVVPAAQPGQPGLSQSYHLSSSLLTDQSACLSLLSWEIILHLPVCFFTQHSRV